MSRLYNLIADKMMFLIFIFAMLGLGLAVMYLHAVQQDILMNQQLIMDKQDVKLNELYKIENKLGIPHSTPAPKNIGD